MTNEELIAWQRREQSPIEKALRRAYQLGQTYWQQADSESYSQNKKSDDTAAKFETLVSEMLAATPKAPSGQQAEPTDEHLAHANRIIAANPYTEYSFVAQNRAVEKDRAERHARTLLVAALAGHQSERPAPAGQVALLLGALKQSLAVLEEWQVGLSARQVARAVIADVEQSRGTEIDG